MANINLTDPRKLNAVVKAENISPRNRVRSIGPKGGASYTRKVLKPTVDHDYDTLLKQAKDDPERLANLLIESDIEVDTETFGRFLYNASQVYINDDKECGKGIVVCSDSSGVFKIKLRHTLDLAIVAFTEGIEILKQLKPQVVESEYAEVISDRVAYQMIKPGLVIDISCLDIISRTSHRSTIDRMIN